jgi:hypothetical protein
VEKYGIDSSRYVEFSYLLYLDLDNVWIDDYVQFHLYGKVPRFVNRISSCVQFWTDINAKDWLIDIIKNGVKIPLNVHRPEYT